MRKINIWKVIARQIKGVKYWHFVKHGSASDLVIIWVIFMHAFRSAFVRNKCRRGWCGIKNLIRYYKWILSEVYKAWNMMTFDIYLNWAKLILVFRIGECDVTNTTGLSVNIQFHQVVGFLMQQWLSSLSPLSLAQLLYISFSFSIEKIFESLSSVEKQVK